MCGFDTGIPQGVDPIDPILRNPLTSGAPTAARTAPEGYDFAVGLATHQTTGKPTLLSNFAERVGAKTYGDVYGGWGFRDMDDLAGRSLSAMQRADRLHVNLDGMVSGPEGLADVVSKGSRGIGVQDVLPDGRLSGNITNWEIWKIQTTAELQSKTVFYLNGRPVSLP